MKAITAARTIDAPVDAVFRTVADIGNFAKAVPQIKKVEFLSESRCGAGTRFRETRVMSGREASVELEVTEYVENQRIRLVADAGGTIWDTTFQVKPANGKTELTMSMDARAHTWLARFFNPLIRGMVVKGVEADMDSVKRHCESSG